jgi:hypothetical protein
MKRFDNLMAAMDITDESRKRALLLHYSGEEVNNLFDTLPDNGEDKDYKKACEALTSYIYTTMASALPRARSATTAPSTITLPVYVNPKAK